MTPEQAAELRRLLVLPASAEPTAVEVLAAIRSLRAAADQAAISELVGTVDSILWTAFHKIESEHEDDSP